MSQPRCQKCGEVLRRANIPPQTKPIELHAFDCSKCHHRTWIEKGLLS